MDKLTKLSAIVINSLGAYCILTLPMIIKVFGPFKLISYEGFLYPIWAILTCSFISILFGGIITIWEEKKLQKKNDS